MTVRRVSIIPARLGSVGINKKNLNKLAHKTLLAHAIQRTHTCEADVWVSTESCEIRDEALNHGARVIKRPDVLAGNNVHAADVVAHAIDYLALSDDTLISMTLPTAPFVYAETMLQAFNLAERGVSVIGIKKTGPMNSVRQIHDKGFLVRNEAFGAHDQRQQSPASYSVSGGVFVCPVWLFKKAKTFHVSNAVPIMLTDLEAIDINTPDDFDLAHLVVAGLLANKEPEVKCNDTYFELYRRFSELR